MMPTVCPVQLIDGETKDDLNIPAGIQVKLTETSVH